MYPAGRLLCILNVKSHLKRRCDLLHTLTPYSLKQTPFIGDECIIAQLFKNKKELYLCVGVCWFTKCYYVPDCRVGVRHCVVWYYDPLFLIRSGS